MQTENDTSKPEDSPEQEAGEGCSGATCSPSSDIQRLRAIFPKILEYLESGACAEDCPIEFMELIPNEVGLAVRKLKREIENLSQWKRDAMLVLSEWESVWEAAGSPERIGESKSHAMLKFIQENRLALAPPETAHKSMKPEINNEAEGTAQTTESQAVAQERLVRQSLQDWVDSGRGDECFWEVWPECPTEIDLTPNMILAVLNSLPNAERTCADD